MKKILATILLLCITCAALIGLTSCSGKVNDNTLYYLPKDDGTYEVVELKDVEHAEITIGDTFNKTKITSIGKDAFKDCMSIRFVYVIDEYLESIGEFAFKDCCNLKLITLPESLKEIKSQAFWDCDALRTVSFNGTGLTTIGSAAFSGCRNLTSIFYGGTMEQWNAVTKGDNWDNDTGAYTIHCSDGDIAK